MAGSRKGGLGSSVHFRLIRVIRGLCNPGHRTYGTDEMDYAAGFIHII